jgi:hypothetical protein
LIAATTAETARYVADNLGPDEICIRLYGRDEASRLAVHVALTSPLSWTAFAPDGEPVAMFGCFPDGDEPFAHGWMFSTANVRRAKVAVFKGMREALSRARAAWGEVRIDAESRSTRQARFLEKIGFRQRTAEIVNGEAFVELAA